MVVIEWIAVREIAFGYVVSNRDACIKSYFLAEIKKVNSRITEDKRALFGNWVTMECLLAVVN
jgi:hypothetical protein